MLLSYNKLIELVNQGVVKGASRDQVNAASIDVTLGKTLLIEAFQGGIVDLSKKQAPGYYEVNLEESRTYDMIPGEFLLGQTREVFYLPDHIAADFRLKSSMARAGLDQALAVWCDPGWNGSVLTIELRNNLRNHILRLTHGMAIGQMIFNECEKVPKDRSYSTKGRFNRQEKASATPG